MKLLLGECAGSLEVIPIRSNDFIDLELAHPLSEGWRRLLLLLLRGKLFERKLFCCYLRHRPRAPSFHFRFLLALLWSESDASLLYELFLQPNNGLLLLVHLLLKFLTPPTIRLEGLYLGLGSCQLLRAD